MADVFPTIGHRFIDTVTATDIRNILLPIEGRGARDVAKRAHETTDQIFRYAIANGKATRNPAAEFKPRDVLKLGRKKDFARVDGKDLPEFSQHFLTFTLNKGSHALFQRVVLRD